MSAPIWSATTGVEGGPHVVLVHGSLDRSAGLLKLSRQLDERFRVTRYDRRGYGRSIGAGGPFGIEEQVADLVGVIGAADGAGEPCIVVAHSYGGDVALALAQRHPESVAGVMVYECPLPWLDWWPADTAGGKAMSLDADPHGAAEAFMRALIGDQKWERLPEATRQARRAEGPAMVGELTDLRRSAPWDVTRIRIPVVAMHGELSRDHQVRAMRTLGDLLGDVEVVAIPGARHPGPNTHPELVAEHVARFVDRCSA